MDRSVDYDHIARTYDRRYQEYQYPGVEQALLQFAASRPRLQVLEVGCGTGHWLGLLSGHGVRLAGLDVSAQMLERAQAGVPGVELIRGPAERLPWRAAAFDRVYCVNALHHFRDAPAFLAEARRVLRPGGAIMTIGLDPHVGADRWFVYDYFEGTLDIDKQRYPSSATIRDWMRVAGFAHCVTREVQYLSLRLPAREALDGGRLDKTVTSQLSVLTDEEYQRGMQRIHEDTQRAESSGQSLCLTAELRLYGTTGSVPGASR